MTHTFPGGSSLSPQTASGQESPMNVWTWSINMFASVSSVPLLWLTEACSMLEHTNTRGKGASGCVVLSGT